MDISHKTFVKTGGGTYLFAGTAHLLVELLYNTSENLKLQAYLNAYEFKLLDAHYSLYNFHTGYSMSMAILLMFIGLLCLTITVLDKEIIGTLCLGAIALCIVYFKYSILIPQLLMCIALLAFMLAYWSYVKMKPENAN